MACTQGPIRGHALLFVTTAPQNLGAPHSGVGRQLLGRAGLADARLSHQHHQAAPARQGIFQCGLQLSHLLLP
ncbi:MAG: hypothetical protein J4O06_14480, partial [Chloroflexi bacterium]|nr:hypothetical protein [Chloroflexota bacterium]